jgi:hypothetical protein
MFAKKPLSFFIIFFAIGVNFASAEVPGHNPELDEKCPEGFEWSTKTVACEQANCPPGARRTYTLECSCGEAWDEENKTCMEGGLAAYCIGPDQDCNSTPGGFDPLSGECKYLEGYVWNDDKTACMKEFPDEISCQVIDLDGNSVPNVKIRFGEYDKADSINPNNSASANTDDKGRVSFSVNNRQTPFVKIIFKAASGYYNSTLTIPALDANRPCIVKVVNDEQIEKHIKSEFTDFLKDACLTEDQIAKVQDVKFVFGADVTNSQYDPELKSMMINSGDLDAGWDSLRRALFHEFGHYISDSIMDPSSWYFKGYPMFGKRTGGKHDNWTINDGGKGEFVPEQVAFEEGFADFMASLYFASIGEVYQENLTTPDAATNALRELGKENGDRIEGVISTFLLEYYKDQIESGAKGPAQAFGDFIRAAQYEQRHAMTWLGVPARTAQEFIAAKINTDQNDGEFACSPKNPPDLAALVNKYGLNGKGEHVVKIVPTTEADIEKAKNVVGTMDFDDVDPTLLGNMIPIPDTSYRFPAGSGVPVVEMFPSDFASGGKVERVAFNPEVTNMFSVDASSGLLSIEEGEAEISDASIMTPNLRIDHKDTRYVVKVGGDREIISSTEGIVELSELGGQGSSYALFEGLSVAYAVDTGFSENIDEQKEVSAEDGEMSDKDVKQANRAGWAAIIIVLVALAAWYLRKKAKEREY